MVILCYIMPVYRTYDSISNLGHLKIQNKIAKEN